MNDLAIRSDNTETVITSSASPSPVSSTTLLEASRRVDWRFLLPNPNLNRVVVAGNPSPSLRESLSLFSQHVTYIEPPYQQAPFDADLIILCGALKTHLPSLLPLVKPSAHLYAEFKAKPSLNSFLQTHPLVYGTKLLHANGFEDIQSHWHAPNFEGCKRIIPLDSPDALAFALRKSDSRAAQLLTTAGVSLAHKTGLLLWAASSFSIIARRGAV